MYRKNLFMALFAAAILMTGAAAVSAQTFMIRGRVELRNASGQAAPLEGATIEGFRTDIKGKSQPTTTNKKGEFSILGLQAGGSYILVASGPGAAPNVINGITMSRSSEEFVFTMDAGDGRRLTQDEAVQMAKSGTAATTGGEVKETPEQKKAREEYEKKKKEVEDRNSKVQNADKVIESAHKAGMEAWKAKNYDAAIAKADEGIAADPDYVLAVPVFMSLKSEALRARGFDKYATSVKSSDAELKKAAKADVLAAYDVAQANIAFTEKATPPTDPKELERHKVNKYNALANAAGALYIMTLNELDQTKGEDAKKIYPLFIAAEPDAAKKQAEQREFADVLRKSGDCEASVIEYQKVLDGTPADPDALAGKGLCMITIGAIKEDKQITQEGLNVLQAYVDVAPEGHKYKMDAKNTIEYLKTEQKIVPQKGATKGVVKKKN